MQIGDEEPAVERLRRGGGVVGRRAERAVHAVFDEVRNHGEEKNDSDGEEDADGLEDAFEHRESPDGENGLRKCRELTGEMQGELRLG